MVFDFDNDTDAINGKRWKDLGKSSLLGCGGYVLLTAVLLFTAPSEVKASLPFKAFFLFNLLFVIARLVSSLKLTKQSSEKINKKQVRPLYASSLALALTWGLFSAYHITSQGIDGYAVILIICVSGLMSGSLTSFLSDRVLSYLYLLTLSAPVILALFTSEMYGLFFVGVSFLSFLILQVRQLFSIYTDGLHKSANLEAARDAALEAARLKTEFVASVSHEIRTPMNGIIGLSGLLVEANLTGEEKRWAESIRLSAENLLEIINDILDFSKIEVGKMKIEAHAFDLKECLWSIHDIFETQSKAKEIPIVLEISSSISQYVESDSTRLRQVLVNLIGNALKFTEKGKVVVSVSSQPDAKTGYSRLYFSVTDTGIGISEKGKTRLFESFSQENTSVSRNYGGTGLGLAISKRLVRLLDGNIGVESELGKGSRFFFDILVKDVSEKDLPQESSPHKDTSDQVVAEQLPLKILVAEDNTVNQLVIRKFLEKMGYRPDFVSNGKEAVQAIERQSYDLILMDMNMPEMSGVEATKKIRELKNITQPYIFALTANVSSQDQEQCRQAGMNDFLTKPIAPKALKSALLKFASAKLAS